MPTEGFTEEDNIQEIDLFISKYDHFTEIPKMELFQYTRASTIRSLVDKKKLWATEHLYLNDPTEFKHGMQMFAAALLNFLIRTGLPQNSISRAMTTFNDGYTDPKIRYFISSFTENGDLLSQWRGYGDSGKGLSIGFDPSKVPLDETLKTSFWCKVIYDDVTKNQIIQSVLNQMVNIWNVIINLGTVSQNHQLSNLIVAYIQVSTLFSLKFKDYAWREEEEWRFVELSSNKRPKKVQVRDRESDLIEYLEVGLLDGFLTSIFVGPRSNFINQRNAIITVTGPGLKVVKSTIPWI